MNDQSPNEKKIQDKKTLIKKELPIKNILANLIEINYKKLSLKIKELNRIIINFLFDFITDKHFVTFLNPSSPYTWG